MRVTLDSLVMENTMSMALIGDCKEAQVVAKEIYGNIISLDDAQCLSDMLTRKMGWPKVEVVKGREARNKHGSIKYINTPKPVMILNKPSVGVVIHELGHMAHRDISTRTHLHNDTFKLA